MIGAMEDFLSDVSGKYRRDGTRYPDGEAGLMEWSKDLEKNRIIAHNRSIYGETISTVWLGLNHNFFSGPPLIFESMILRFGRGKGSSGEMQWRYATEAEARAGHRKLCWIALVPPPLRRRWFE